MRKGTLHPDLLLSLPLLALLFFLVDLRSARSSPYACRVVGARGH